MYYLFGLRQDTMETMWNWVDGTELLDSNAKWNSGEPNDSAGNEDCAVIHSTTGKWYDMGCHRLFPFVCERRSK